VRGMAIEEVLRDVGLERVRQEDLRQSGKFLWTCATDGVPLDRKMSVLSEEVGEVAKEVVDVGIARDKYEREKMAFPRHREVALLLRIRKELVQVAAVCVAWIEAIDRDLDKLDTLGWKKVDETDLGQPPTGGEAA
jgi:NTP pyrophosphatase (non-canonical NTP hydrolase)